MTPEEYEKHAKELGIDRGKLAEGFSGQGEGSEQPDPVEVTSIKGETKDTVKAAVEKGLIKYPTLEEAQKAMPEAAAPVPAVDVEVTAEKPQEMEGCQRELISWAKNKVASVQNDFAELDEAYQIAVKQKWKSSTLKRHRDKAEKQVHYYVKMLGVLEAGYVIVPNMPGGIFAVRTDKVCPSKTWKYYFYDAARVHAPGLPSGEGKYVNRENKVHTHKVTDPSDKVVKEAFRALDFNEVDFPIAMAKPRIMDATTRAMALNIFDEFMILPTEARNEATAGPTTRVRDPIILGRIVMRPSSYGEKVISFMIAWHIDTRSL